MGGADAGKRIVPEVASYMLDGELRVSGSDNSSALHRRDASKSASEGVLAVSAPSVPLCTVPSQQDPSAPFPHALVSLPESQQPGPTPQSVPHGTHSSNDSKSDHSPALPTPRRPVQSGYGSSTRDVSPAREPDSATAADAPSLDSIGSAAIRQISKNIAGVRLSRESCFTGDTLVSMHGSERQRLSQGSQSSSVPLSSSGSEPFSVQDAIQRTISYRESRRSNSPRTGSASDIGAASIHVVSAADCAAGPCDRASRLTELVIGREIQQVLNPGWAGSAASTDHEPPSSPQEEKCVRNSSLAHDYIRELDVQQAQEHTNTVSGPGRSDPPGASESRAPEADMGQLQKALNGAHSLNQHTRSVSPFSVDRVGCTAVGGMPESFMSGATSSIWTLSSPEPSFTVSGRSLLSCDGNAAPSMQHDVSPARDQSHQGSRSGSRASQQQQIEMYGKSHSGSVSTADAMDQASPIFMRGVHRSDSALVVQSFSGWNTDAGTAVLESVAACGTHAAPPDSTPTAINVQDQQEYSAIRTVAEVGATQTEPVPSEAVADLGILALASTEPESTPPPPMVSDELPEQRGSLQNGPSAHGSAPLADLQPAVAATLLVEAQNNDYMPPLEFNEEAYIHAAEPAWAQVEVAWATACDLTTQERPPQSLKCICT